MKLSKPSLWRRAAPHLTVLAVIALLFAAVAWLRGTPDERCDEICAMLKHKKIGVTRDGCISEDPETGERVFHTFRKF
jgi:hypothetical protein